MEFLIESLREVIAEIKEYKNNSNFDENDARYKDLLQERNDIYEVLKSRNSIITLTSFNVLIKQFY
jgi:hypothetical protein